MSVSYFNEDKMINFYAEKSPNTPRMIYRHLNNKYKISKSFDLNIFITEYMEKFPSPDYHKFTWSIPNYLQNTVNIKSDFNNLNQLFSKKKLRRPERLKRAVYPHVSDEFSLTQEFFEEVFNSKNRYRFSFNEKVFTIGSCFARNFAKFLTLKGLACNNYGQAEDLNSPGSNYLLLNYASQIYSTIINEKIKNELLNIYQEISPNELESLVENIINQLKSLNNSIANSNTVIVTLGNIVDYYINNDIGEFILVPKFLAMTSSEDINDRENVVTRMNKIKASIRLSTFNEVSFYINGIYNSIRAINNKANIIFTVSPVPIDSVLGLKGTDLSAIEIDCVSKSTIRTALHEIMHSNRSIFSDEKTYYLPSFEIVKWIAPVVGVPVYGNEDAASRHVSNIVLNAVCNYAYFV